VIAIVGAIIGGVIIVVGQAVLRRRRESKGGYTGVWEGKIFATDGSVVKKDRVYLRQDGDEASGTIERLFPASQKHRRWHLSGRFRGKDFFAIFWSMDPSLTTYGSWYVQQTDDDTFSGYYLRLSEKDRNLITPVSLEVRRQR
jgi:hypothetical protein